MNVFRRARTFFRDTSGVASVEFPFIFFMMFCIAMFAFQVSYAMFELISAEKAAQTAARIAAVRDPVHTGVPISNGVASPDKLGKPCNGSGDNCVSPAPGKWSCNPTPENWGVGCDADRMLVIFNDMKRQGINIVPRDVTVTYTYVNLGFAGGPFIPLIEVTVAAKPFMLSFGFGEALRRREVSAHAIGEDMATTY